MYAKRIQIVNYGPIRQLDIKFPIDDDGPKPVVLIGPNGSGKSVLLSHIVNALMMAQQRAYSETPEVAGGKVYKLRSPDYVLTDRDYSFTRVDFVDDFWSSELQLNRSKKDYDPPPEGILGTDAQTLWDDMGEHVASHLGYGGLTDWTRITDLFTKNCILYFPPNRFEEPAWLNEMNLKSKVSHMDLSHIEGHTNRKIVNHSPLRQNQSWIFDLIYDSRVFELKCEQMEIPQQASDGNQSKLRVTIYQGHDGRASRLGEIALDIVQIIMGKSEKITLGIGDRHNRTISIMKGDESRTREEDYKMKEEEPIVPNIFQLSSGEVSLLNLFFSILRDYDLTRNQFTSTEDIKGIVIVDEIDLHLHARHQYEVLPRLIKMFPRIQFILTSHSPLFILGLQKLIDEHDVCLYQLPEGRTVNPEEFGEFGVAYRAFSETQRHYDEIRSAVADAHKPVIFVDGKTDVRYHLKAAELLGFDYLLSETDFRDGGGMLKNIWSGLTTDHVDRKKVIVLHDPEDRVHSDTRVNVYRRKIDQLVGHPVQNGVENLFNRETLQRASEFRPAFIDKIRSHNKIERGMEVEVPEVWTVNKDEKTNLCNWICKHGTANDFLCFRPVLEMLQKILVEND